MCKPLVEEGTLERTFGSNWEKMKANQGPKWNWDPSWDLWAELWDLDSTWSMGLDGCVLGLPGGEELVWGHLAQTTSPSGGSAALRAAPALHVGL